VKDLDASKRGAGVVLIKDKAKFKQAGFTPTADHLSGDGSTAVTTGALVKLAGNYNSEKGTPGAFYKYIETDDGASMTTTFDLTTANYKDTTKWAIVDVYVTLYQMTGNGLYISTDNGDTATGPALQSGYDLREEVLYNPASGWRFGWTVGLSQRENYRSVVTESAWVFIRSALPTRGRGRPITVEEQPTLQDESGYYFYAPSDPSDYAYNKVETTNYDSRWSSGTPGVGTYTGVQVEQDYRSTGTARRTSPATTRCRSARTSPTTTRSRRIGRSTSHSSAGATARSPSTRAERGR